LWRGVWKPFKPFPAKSRSATIWLKPGVNENGGGRLTALFEAGFAELLPQNDT